MFRQFPNSLLNLSLTFFGLLLMLVTTQAQSTSFTYQGFLRVAGQPATGAFDLTFSLWDTASGGSRVGGPVTNTAVVISDGVFTATIDFGQAFNGGDRWLEICLRTNSIQSFECLSPRQAITPTPQALYARSAEASGIQGTLSPTSLGPLSITQDKLATGAAAKDVTPATNTLWAACVALVTQATNQLNSAWLLRNGIPVLNVRQPPFSQAGSDFAAIQMALDYCTNQANSPIVYLPAGDYWITNTLRFKAEGTTLIGDGYFPPHSTAIRLDHAGFPGGVGISAAPYSGSTLHLRSIRNLVVKGKGIGSDCVGISFGAAYAPYAGYGGFVENVAVNSCGIGLAVSNFITLRIIKSDFVGCGTCVVLCNADSVSMEDCRTGYPIGSTPSGTGVLISQGSTSGGLGITIKGGEHGAVTNGWIRAPDSPILTIEGGNYESWSMDTGFYFEGEDTRVLAKNVRAHSTNVATFFRFEDGAGHGSVIIGGAIGDANPDSPDIVYRGNRPVYIGTPLLCSNVLTGVKQMVGSILIETNYWPADQTFNQLGVARTNSAPANTVSPEAWTEIKVGDQTFKVPLFR